MGIERRTGKNIAVQRIPGLYESYQRQTNVAYMQEARIGITMEEHNVSSKYKRKHQRDTTKALRLRLVFCNKVHSLGNAIVGIALV